jgi:hypothetical protein
MYMYILGRKEGGVYLTFSHGQRRGASRSPSSPPPTTAAIRIVLVIGFVFFSSSTTSIKFQF